MSPFRPKGHKKGHSLSQHVTLQYSSAWEQDQVAVNLLIGRTHLCFMEQGVISL